MMMKLMKLIKEEPIRGSYWGYSHNHISQEPIISRSENYYQQYLRISDTVSRSILNLYR